MSVARATVRLVAVVLALTVVASVATLPLQKRTLPATGTHGIPRAERPAGC